MDGDKVHRHRQEADIDNAVRQSRDEVHGEGNHVRRDFRRPVTDPVQRVLHRVAEQVLHLGAEAVRRIVYQVLSRLLHGFDSVGNHASGLSDHLRRLFQHDGHAPGYDAGQEPQHQQDADQHADAAFDFQFVLRKTDDRLQRGCQRNCDNERRQLVPDLRDSPEKEHNQDDCTQSFQSQPFSGFSLFAHTLPSCSSGSLPACCSVILHSFPVHFNCPLPAFALSLPLQPRVLLAKSAASPYNLSGQNDGKGPD